MTALLNLTTGMVYLRSVVTVSQAALNDNTTRLFSCTASAATLVQNTSAGTDEALATTYVAGSFVQVGTEIGGLNLRLKRDAGVTAGNVRVTLRTNVAGAPNTTDITWREPTGQPTIVYASDLTTAYQTMQFRMPVSGLTPASTYWFVIQISGVIGGNIVLDRQAAGSNLYATSADGTTWTPVAKQPWYQVVGATGSTYYGNSETDWAFYGVSTSGIPFRGVGTHGPGAKFDSVDNFGAGGSSVNDAGLRGSSVNSFGGIFVSTGSGGLQAQTTAATMPGAQLVATTGPGVQLATTTGAAAQYFASDPTVGGAAWTEGVAGEEITLSGGVTTDSVASLIPAGSFVTAVTWRITQTISGGSATAFQIGTATSATNFENTNSTLAAGTTGYGMNYLTSFAAPGGFLTATKVRITLNGTSAAGKIRVVVYYRAISVPSS